MIKNDNIKKEKRVNPQKKLCPDCDKSFMKSYIKTCMEKMHGCHVIFVIASLKQKII